MARKYVSKWESETLIEIKSLIEYPYFFLLEWVDFSNNIVKINRFFNIIGL